MNESEAKKLSGKEIKIKIDDKDEITRSLPGDMTMERFKSFVLTLTDNQPFYLNSMLSNN